VVFACVLGARAVVAVARLEGWPRFEPSTVPALWGVCAAAVAFHLLGASVWSCGGGGGAWGMWWALGVVAALALAHLSRAGRKGGV
jgi:hypothetical protein